ncbi:MAG: sigma-54 dependent transcriptional regulator [Candidatus Poribacteria bacterium]|nr:sigma-54 dependent transcriptional regulator [Candidatus Poribacteria bacterium]
MNQQTTFIELPSAPMQAIYNIIQQVVKAKIPFFITGETGVGKEGIARYIHESSLRRDKPFIAINCGRFSAELLQSELFGHEAGAFTSAIRQRQGAFEAADGGILFLDEVPEMSLDAQKMLLRVLDTATFTRLGGNEVLTVDVHIIAATNRDIAKAVAKKEFREDLYYRLKGMMLHLPPLRERTEDIAPLVTAFIIEFSTEYGKNVTGIASEALKRLEQAAWPGNIRQLRSTVQTAVALATIDELELKDFPDIYPEFVQTLISIWQTLPSETQHAIWETLPLEIQHAITHEVSTRAPEPWRTLQAAYMPKTSEEGGFLNIENMNLNQILRAVSQRRIEQHTSLREAAESLDIDLRTLQKYAQWEEPKE